MSRFKFIENVNIITMNENRDLIENGVVLIEDNKIIYVGNESGGNSYRNIDDVEIIDGEDGILMPGMINCHTHASMIPFRSLADDYKDRLKRYLFPLEQRLVNRELVYKGAKYAIAEMLLGGVTTFCDMYYFEDEVAKAAEELKIRGVFCETVLDFPSPDSENAYGGIEYAKGFIENWKDNELITPGIAPHAPYSNSSEKLKEAYELSDKYKVPFTMHVAEMDYEVKKYKDEYNMTPVQYLESLGILSSNFLGGHMVLVNDEDIEILKKYNVKVSHNIGANSKGAKGVMPILKMKEAGIDIGLGSDGPMSGNTIDIITQMGLVGKIQKLFNNDRSILPAKELVEMATMGGAKALGMESEVGSIEVGKKGDLVILETKSINMQPIYDYYSTVVYSANPGNVDTVLVNGKVVVKNKELISGEISEIRRDLLSMKKEIERVAKEL